MTLALDDAGIERAARRYRVALPRSAQAGRVGGVLGIRAGGSMELHDFRAYQPGDDVRQLDWNAVARTGQLIVRTRREEVSPRVEVVVDLSRSMALTPAKEARAKELALVLLRAAMSEGLEAVVVLAGQEPRSISRPPDAVIRDAACDGSEPLVETLARASLKACGLRIVLSDFLFDAPMQRLASRLAERAASCALVQLLAEDDVEPSFNGTLTLVDSETGERIDREVDERVLDAYRRRFAAHQAALESAAKRTQARLVTVDVDAPLDTILRAHLLGPVVEVRAR